MTSRKFHNHIAYINPNARMRVRFGTDLAQALKADLVREI